MIIRSLKVTNFRNYDRFNITLGSKMNIFIGNNASGKTNILEAIAILGLTKSFRNGLDCDVIKFCRKKAVIEGRVLNNKQIKDLKIEFLEKDKNIYVNSKKVKKYADYLSNLNIVVFTPNDLDIIKGSPSIRRNLLNMTLSQISYSYLVTYNEYNKILKTRNEYLKILFTNGIADKTYLDVLTDKLVEKAVLIYQERYKYLSLINSYISDIYNNITEDNRVIKIEYKPNIVINNYESDIYNNITEDNRVIKIEYKPNIVINNYEIEEIRKSLTDAYRKNYRRELSSGMTLFGPHRDDFCFIMDNNTDMKIYASQGQQKCAVLAYKLASIPIFKENNGTNPVLLLDDIFSELDLNKRNKLLKYVNEDIQSIITTTDLKNISKKTLDSAIIFKVNDGKVERS